MPLGNFGLDWLTFTVDIFLSRALRDQQQVLSLTFRLASKCYNSSTTALFASLLFSFFALDLCVQLRNYIPETLAKFYFLQITDYDSEMPIMYLREKQIFHIIDFVLV